MTTTDHLRMLAALVAAAVVAVAILMATLVAVSEPAQAAFPGKNGRLAFVNDGEIYTIRPNGTGLKKLTSSPLIDAQPAWSPNGRKIAFASR